MQPLLQQVMEKSCVPGISAAVLRDGTLTSAAVGLSATTSPSPMTTESRFSLGSMGKFLTGVAAAESLASGELDRHAPVREYIPELAGSDMGDSVSVRHVMSHATGCYQGEGGVFEETLGLDAGWDTFVAHFAAARRLFAPGTVFSYEGSNYVLVGEMLRRLHGCSPRELIRRRVLEPLGIECGGHDLDRDRPQRYVENHREKAPRSFEPCAHLTTSEPWDASLSGLTLSMPELVTIAASVVGSSAAPSSILSVRARELLLTQVIDVPVAPEWPDKDCATSSYGLGCMGYANSLVGHSGVASGQCCALHFDPIRKTAFAVGINAPTLRSRDGLLSALMRSAGYDAEQPNSRPARGPFEQSDLVGDYIGGSHGRILEVRADGTDLVCQLGTRSAVPGSTRPPFPVIRFHMTQAGEAVLHESSRPIPMCFFREPETGKPCLLAGARAYARIDEIENFTDPALLALLGQC